MKKIRITTIEISAAGEEPIRLSLDEARDLYAQLRELFGENKPREIIIERDRYPAPWRPYRPYWLDAPPELPRREPRILCRSTATGLAVAYLGEDGEVQVGGVRT